jgi:hypothetical protein
VHLDRACEIVPPSCVPAAVSVTSPAAQSGGCRREHICDSSSSAVSCQRGGSAPLSSSTIYEQPARSALHARPRSTAIAGCKTIELGVAVCVSGPVTWFSPLRRRARPVMQQGRRCRPCSAAGRSSGRAQLTCLRARWRAGVRHFEVRAIGGAVVQSSVGLSSSEQRRFGAAACIWSTRQLTAVSGRGTRDTLHALSLTAS